MKVVISGASGLIGSALVPYLTAAGHPVARLVRGKAAGGFSWDPSTGRLDPAAVDGADAVIHLAGENVGEGRWTPEKKRRILESRVDGTRAIAEAIARASRRPSVLISPSAIGFYGDRGDAELDEASASGEGFLAEVCRGWEEAARPAAEAGVRVVHPRLGVVLSVAGGALAKMLLPFQLGAGGRIGPGRQWMSWIALDDVLDALHHALVTPTLAGAVNLVAPEPVTNATFTATLGKVLGRPTVATLPTFAAKALFGERGESLLLSSARVLPTRLLASGYVFRFPSLEGALRRALGK